MPARMGADPEDTPSLERLLYYRGRERPSC
jgi:hypothetical protein